MRVFSSLLLPLVLAACGLEQSFEQVKCDLASQASDVSGVWYISGNGVRTRCDDPALLGEVTLHSPLPLLVTQGPLDGASYALQLEKPLVPKGGTFSFDGVVAGACVVFETRESTSAYTLSYNYQGTFDKEASKLSGAFTGEGPSGCISSGTFDVSITP